MFHGRQAVGNLPECVRELRIDHQQPVTRMIDQPSEPGRVEARIERVDHGADPHRAIPCRHMRQIVPQQGAHPVPKADPMARKRRAERPRLLLQ
jgi:hypothetical protein